MTIKTFWFSNEHKVKFWIKHLCGRWYNYYSQTFSQNYIPRKTTTWLLWIHPDLKNMKFLTEMFFSMCCWKEGHYIKIYLKRGLFRMMTCCQYFQILSLQGNIRCVCNRKSNLQYIVSNCIQTNLISNWLLICFHSLQTFLWRETLVLDMWPSGQTL